MTKPTDFRVGDIVRVKSSKISRNIGKLCVVLGDDHGDVVVRCLLGTSMNEYHDTPPDVRHFMPEFIELVERDGQLYD